MARAAHSAKQAYLHARVALATQLPHQELVELGVEHAIGHSLQAPRASVSRQAGQAAAGDGPAAMILTAAVMAAAAVSATTAWLQLHELVTWMYDASM